MALASSSAIVPGQPQTFSHPDYTVGPGITPDPALRLAGLCGHATITADQELHLAPKVFGFCRRSDIYKVRYPESSELSTHTIAGVIGISNRNPLFTLVTP